MVDDIMPDEKRWYRLSFWPCQMTKTFMQEDMKTPCAKLQTYFSNILQCRCARVTAADRLTYNGSVINMVSTKCFQSQGYYRRKYSLPRAVTGQVTALDTSRSSLSRCVIHVG